MRTLASALAVVMVGALIGCGPGGPVDAVDTIELDVRPAPDIAPELPEDPGTIDFATAEVLTDYQELTGETVAVDEILEAERLAGVELRAALAEGSAPPGEPEALGGDVVIRTASVRSVGAPGGAGESFLASSVISGMLVPAMYGSSRTQELKVGQSNDLAGSGASGRTRGDGTLEVTRTGDNELELSVSHLSTSDDGVRTSNRLAFEGVVCPGDDGEFDFTVRLDREVSGGGGATVTQELAARISGRLGEDGYPEAMSVDGTQGTRHAPVSGQAVYVETRQRLENANILNVYGLAESRAELVRSSSRATDADVKRLASAASERLATLAWGAVTGVQATMWNNGCVRVEASAPKTVSPRSGVEFPVTVRSKLSGEEFASGVEATLTGSDSVDPGSFTSTRSITFVAGEAGTSGSIRLKAASRRGTAETTVTIATTGRAYFAQGTNGDVTAIGVICDLAQPFELSGSGTVTKFSPQNASGGTFSYRDDGTYGEGLIDLAASGSYSVALAGDGATGTITTEGTGTTGFDTPLGRQELEFPANLTFSLTEIDDGTPEECAG